MRFVYLLMEFTVDYDYADDRVLGIFDDMDAAVAAADEWSDEGARSIDVYEVPLGHFIDHNFFTAWYTHPDNPRVEYRDEARYEKEQAERREKMKGRNAARRRKHNPLRTATKAQGWPYSTFGQNTRAEK